MAGVAYDFPKLSWQVGDGVGVCLGFHFLKTKPRLVERGGGGAAHILAHQWERAPHGEALEGKDDLHTCLALYTRDEIEIVPQAAFVEDEAGGGYFLNVHVLI